MFWRTVRRTLGLVELVVEFFHEFLMIEIKIGRLAGIFAEVAKLAGSIRGGVVKGKRFQFRSVVVVATGSLMVEIFPMPAANGKPAVAADGLFQQAGLDRCTRFFQQGRKVGSQDIWRAQVIADAPLKWQIFTLQR